MPAPTSSGPASSGPAPASSGTRPQPGSATFVILIAAILTMSAMTIDINLPAIPSTAAAFATS
jgi:hypothetical protein